MTVKFSPEAFDNMHSLVEHLSNEDMLGRLLRAQLHLERLILDFICKRVIRPDYIEEKGFGFMARLNIAMSLGLDEDLYAPMKQINLMRNEYAHKQGFEITAEKVAKLENKLSARLMKAVSNSFNIAKKEDLEIDSDSYVDLHYSKKLTLIILTIWSFMMYQSNKISTEK